MLIYQDGFFEVFKARNGQKRFESVYQSNRSTVAIEVIDDVKGHEVLRVQFSPTTHEILDFVEKRTNFQVIFFEYSHSLLIRNSVKF